MRQPMVGNRVAINGWTQGGKVAWEDSWISSKMERSARGSFFFKDNLCSYIWGEIWINIIIYILGVGNVCRSLQLLGSALYKAAQTLIWHRFDRSVFSFVPSRVGFDCNVWTQAIQRVCSAH